VSEEHVAVVTGASSGIGEATAVALAAAGFKVFLGARRAERIARIAQECGGTALPLDVTSQESVDEFVAGLPNRVHLLVNNAGGALGLDTIAKADDQRWRTMFEVNVLGTVRMVRALLPKLLASGNGQVINVGSTSGFETYSGGAGYTAAKHGERALTKTLRLELLGQPVRVSEICPGLVDTEFSLVRFGGDQERAASVYAGMTPLKAEDVAEAVVFAATRPPHVDIDEIVIRPRDQATAAHVYRNQDEQ